VIFVDESIQHPLGFICVGFVYTSEDIAPGVHGALRDAGLEPCVDEYKSGRRMTGIPHLHVLREGIGRIAVGCRLAVYIAPPSERARLLDPILEVARSIVQANDLPRPQPLFLDEGITGRSRPDAAWLDVHTGCDSKQVPGIQLADYVAYHCGYLLKCCITEQNKPITLDDTPHPLAGETVDLDWLVRTEMRRSFFHEPRDYDSITGDDWFFNVAGYGAFFSPDFRQKYAKQPRQRSGQCTWAVSGNSLHHLCVLKCSSA